MKSALSLMHRTSLKFKRGWIFLLLLSVQELGYLFFLSLGPPFRPTTYALLLAIGLLAFCCLFAFPSRSPHARRYLLIAIGAACVFRLTLLVTSPSLSDDIFRYRWDGKVQANGFNPYRYPPSSPKLERLRDEQWQMINHKEIRSIYPPLSQLFFLLSYSLFPSIFTLKFLLFIGDGLCLLLILGLIRDLGQPPQACLLYAINPLIIVEIVGTGHYDVIPSALVLFALWLMVRKREWGAHIALAAAILTKLYALALIPLLIRKKRLHLLLVYPLTLGLAYLPYRSAGLSLFDGLRDYVQHWRFNDAFFSFFEWSISASNVTPVLKAGISFGGRWFSTWPFYDTLYTLTDPTFVSKTICATLFLTILLLQVCRPKNPVRASLIVLGALLLFLPTLHPWYLVWLLPIASALNKRSWFLFSVTSFLAYLPLITGHWNLPLWIRALEYAPFFLALGLESEAFRSRIALVWRKDSGEGSDLSRVGTGSAGRSASQG